MNNGKIARIILSRILKMPLEQYLTYINKKTASESTQYGANPIVRESHCRTTGFPQNMGNGGRRPPFRTVRIVERKKKLVYARVVVRSGELTFEITDPRLANKVPLDHYKIPGNGIVALKWINTRNAFSKHILRNLLHYQREFWRSGKEVDLKPLTLKQFLLLYPFTYLDESRLSRLVSSLVVETPHGKLISLRELFPSKKRCCAYRIEEIINQNDAPLKDKDIRNLIGSEGIHLSVRTICNCRKLLSIPNYKQRLSHYYGKDIRFSDYVKLSKGQYNRIPSECGVYELSTANKIQYARHRCDVLYIGSSKHIRKRLLSYSGSKGKNARLKHFANGSDIFARCCLAADYIHLEKQLLKHFKMTYGELPKANKLGG